MPVKHSFNDFQYQCVYSYFIIQSDIEYNDLQGSGKCLIIQGRMDVWKAGLMQITRSMHLCSYAPSLQTSSSSSFVHSLWLSTSVVKCTRSESLFVDVLIGQFYWTLKLTLELKRIQETTNCGKIANPSGQLRVHMCWICIQYGIISSHLPEQALTPTFQKKAVKSVSWLFTKYTSENIPHH